MPRSIIPNGEREILSAMMNATMRQTAQIQNPTMPVTVTPKMSGRGTVGATPSAASRTRGSFTSIRSPVSPLVIGVSTE